MFEAAENGGRCIGSCGVALALLEKVGGRFDI